MIDFWELTGRLLMMAQTKRDEIYNSFPIGADGSILQGHANTATLPFPPEDFYDRLRGILHDRYAAGPIPTPVPGSPQLNPKLILAAPAISMFALGEIGVVIFDQQSRTVFDILSNFLLNQPALGGKDDKNMAPVAYMVLALLVIDKTTRDTVATGEFLALDPGAEKPALQALAKDPLFVKMADHFCFDCRWGGGSCNTLRPQTYQNGKIPFRHFRFIEGLS